MIFGRIDGINTDCVSVKLLQIWNVSHAAINVGLVDLELAQHLDSKTAFCHSPEDHCSHYWAARDQVESPADKRLP